MTYSSLANYFTAATHGARYGLCVDYFRPSPVTPRGNAYILLFTDRFKRRADMYAVTGADFTADGTANILVHECLPLWGCPVYLMSENRNLFCSTLSQAVYKPLALCQIPTSSYHHIGNRVIERFIYTMAQLLSMRVNAQHDDWDLQLLHVEFSYNNSVSAATGLALNAVHMGRLPRLPLTIFERSSRSGNHSLDRDQLDYDDIAVSNENDTLTSSPENKTRTTRLISTVETLLLRTLCARTPKLAIGRLGYNTSATIRQCVEGGTDSKVLKSKTFHKLD